MNQELPEEFRLPRLNVTRGSLVFETGKAQTSMRAAEALSTGKEHFQSNRKVFGATPVAADTLYAKIL